ncbi:hypothetical protein ACQ4PT_041099 [Festuca glaucescens]
MSCVSLLLLLCLLLAALHPFAATAHRGLLMAATGDEEAKLARTEMAAKEADEATRKMKEERTKWRHFRTRKLPSDAKSRFDGRAPFTADYSGIHSSPSKHH